MALWDLVPFIHTNSMRLTERTTICILNRIHRTRLNNKYYVWIYWVAAVWLNDDDEDEFSNETDTATTITAMITIQIPIENNAQEMLP